MACQCLPNFAQTEFAANIVRRRVRQASMMRFVARDSRPSRSFIKNLERHLHGCVKSGSDLIGALNSPMMDQLSDDQLSEVLKLVKKFAKTSESTLQRFHKLGLHKYSNLRKPYEEWNRVNEHLSGVIEAIELSLSDEFAEIANAATQQLQGVR